MSAYRNWPLYVEVTQVYRIDYPGETCEQARHNASMDGDLHECFDRRSIIDGWWEVVLADDESIYVRLDPKAEQVTT